MKCLLQIQSNKLVSIKHFFLYTFKVILPFVVKFLLFRKLFEILTLLEISKPYLDCHVIKW